MTSEWKVRLRVKGSDLEVGVDSVSSPNQEGLSEHWEF